MLQKSETKLPKMTRYCGETRVMLMYCITVQSFLMLAIYRAVCLVSRMAM